MSKIILFDLDSTLLQMNQDEFLKCYFSDVQKIISGYGYDSKEFMDVFQKSAYSILNSDGIHTNEELFWKAFSNKYDDLDKINKIFNDYYDTDFDKIANIVNKSDLPRRIIDELKSKGYTLILATNPLFPIQCTKNRIEWAGLEIDDFLYVSTYENSKYSKPNHLYYEEIFNKLNLEIEGATMVGNDLFDDFSDLPSSMNKILITDYLINTKKLPLLDKSYTLKEFYDIVKKEF